jgi:hypothetical protein
MPNHVTNIVTFSGKGAKELMDKLFDNDDTINFNNLYPMPKELEDTTAPSRESNQELIAKYGCDNWYDWKCTNWGTKWGGYDGYRNSETECVFNTAWSTPFNFFEYVSNLYPSVEIEVKFADEDFGYNVGQYTLLNGDLVEENVPEGGSPEALKMAMNISGDEYYCTEYIADCYGKDEFEAELGGGNKFIKTILDMCYDEQLVPTGGEGGFVCEHLKERAIKDEKFEYANELEKEIVRCKDC